MPRCSLPARSRSLGPSADSATHSPGQHENERRPNRRGALVVRRRAPGARARAGGGPRRVATRCDAAALGSAIGNTPRSAFVFAGASGESELRRIDAHGLAGYTGDDVGPAELGRAGGWPHSKQVLLLHAGEVHTAPADGAGRTRGARDPLGEADVRRRLGVLEHRAGPRRLGAIRIGLTRGQDPGAGGRVGDANRVAAREAAVGQYAALLRACRRPRSTSRGRRAVCIDRAGLRRCAGHPSPHPKNDDAKPPMGHECPHGNLHWETGADEATWSTGFAAGRCRLTAALCLDEAVAGNLAAAKAGGAGRLRCARPAFPPPDRPGPSALGDRSARAELRERRWIA